MRPNPNATNRSALASASHAKSYDPSAEYRARLNPPAPPVNIEMPAAAQDVPTTNIDPRTGVIKRIPQFYYPRYNETDDPPITQPIETNRNVPRPSNVVRQPAAKEVLPYSQPGPWSEDPYAPNPYYPYGTPYLIPMTTNVNSPEEVPAVLDQSKSDVIAAHQKDADLSRLEVYHFTPKQNGLASMVPPPAQPIIQYHVYPQVPGPAAAPVMPVPQQPQQQFPPYPYPWYGYPPNMPPYIPDPSQQEFPYIETKARGSQTEPPTTKNRGVSPIYFDSIAPTYDEDGYPYIHHRTTHTDRYNLPTGRINQRFYDSNRSTPLADCRCLDCQRERAKVLNYYPD